MLYIQPDQVKNGRIDHVDIGQAMFVDCSNLINLIELPPWPHVEIVSCINCSKLTKLPMWPMIKQVFCTGCSLLTQLPCWKLVRVVDLSHCTLIKYLPMWPLIKRIFCFGCFQLQHVPSNIKVVHINKCPFVLNRAMVTLAKVEYLDTDMRQVLFKIMYPQ